MTTLFVISGPSGAGKSVLIERLLARDQGMRFSVSCTTRQPREGEEDGVDYHFISRDRFEADLRAGRFFEHAEFSGNLYGTHFQELEEAALQRRDLLLDIEVQGARQLQEKCIDAVYIFVVPPSFKGLERRLRNRNTENEAAIERRLKQAVHDMAEIGRYQYIIINDELEEAFTQLQSIVIAERIRWHRMESKLGPALDSFRKQNTNV
ncbi:MAG: guanylate kinase [Acidobacteria bacterium]|nr:guanylate kinase [Acidobacteriota bacterium]